jgi:hypothetical protein
MSGGRLHSVEIEASLLVPAEFRFAGSEIVLHWNGNME